MVTLTNADKALKTFYLGVLAEQLNTGINPLFAKIGQTSADVWGKEIKKLAVYGLNGGIGSGAENDDLPASGGNNYAEFTLTLKNLFGKIELSDKAVRASQNSAGAFVNLLNAEMDGLLKAGKFNFGRMLFGNGSGLIAESAEAVAAGGKTVAVKTVKYLMEGITVDVFNADGTKNAALSGARIVSVDRKNNEVTLSRAASAQLAAGAKMYVQGSKDNEITGLEAVFGNSEYIYGLKRSDYSFLTPYTKTENTAVTTSAIQDAIDSVEETSGGGIDMIVGSYKMRKQYVDFLAKNRTNIDYLNLDGGYKALSYAGVPFVADRFVADNDIYLLNTSDFKLHQLCDWRWLEGEGGSVLNQIPGKACYTATLVKYADLLCERPMGQAKLTFTGTSGSGASGADLTWHTVTFTATEEGAVCPAAQQVADGKCAVEPKDAKLLGFNFTGWLKDDVEYDFATPVTQDLELVAEFQ